jgi:hypothetical protein
LPLLAIARYDLSLRLVSVPQSSELELTHLITGAVGYIDQQLLIQLTIQPAKLDADCRRYPPAKPRRYEAEPD